MSSPNEQYREPEGAFVVEPPQLTPGFQAARAQAVLASTATYAVALGFDPDWLPFSIPQSVRPSLVLAPVLAYCIARLGTEWFQSDRLRRRRISSRVDFVLTLGVALPAVFWLADDIVGSSSVTVPVLTSTQILIALVLALFGVLLGFMTHIWGLNLFLIRTEDEARNLALPRVPNAVRATYRIAYIMIPFSVAVGFVSSQLEEPLDRAWPWLVALPAVFTAIGGLIATLYPKEVGLDGVAHGSAMVHRLSVHLRFTILGIRFWALFRR